MPLLPSKSALVSPRQAQAYSAFRLQPLVAGIEDSGEKGAVEGEGGRAGMADLTKARPEEMQSASGRGGTDPWSAPGGPASPVPGPGVSKKSRPRLSSASLVYNLAAARPVAGGEVRNVPCAVRGTPGELVESSAPPRRG